MAELDLSLSDALTDGGPQRSPESRVERDFISQLESETFEDEVGETVGKTDYIPLLDNDDRAEGSGLENGEKELHGVQKPGLKLAASHPEAQGEVRPRPMDQHQLFNTDLFTDFSQPVEVSVAPLSVKKPPSIAEPQLATPQSASGVPKDHSPMIPEPQPPRSPLDLPPGAIGDSWPTEACLASDLPFTPSVSTVISRHAGHLGTSPEDQPDGWLGRESGAYAGGDEKDVEGSDRKQKRKKKRRPKDDGPYEHTESRGPAEAQVQGETSPGEDFYHRIGPRRDRGDAGWEEQLGKGRGKKNKSRKKIPEEWSVMAEPFVPSSAGASAQIVSDVMMGLGSAADIDASFADQPAWQPEPLEDEGLIPPPLSQDQSSIIIPISPLVLNSELKATAPPFTMPGSLPKPDDSFDLLMELENGNQVSDASRTPEKCGDLVDSGIFVKTSLQDSQVLADGETSAFSSASKSSPSFKDEEVLATAPPLSPSDASWFLNESQVSTNDIFEFSDSSGHQLPLGLSFDTPSPAPLRSPKTTAQDFQPKDSKKSARKSPQSSKSPTSQEAKNFPPEESPVISPGSPPMAASALNPAAKPFFPSFADSAVESMDVLPASPNVEVEPEKSEKEEKKDDLKNDDKLEDSFRIAEVLPSQDKDEQKSITVEFTEPAPRMDTELPKIQPEESKKEVAKKSEHVENKAEETLELMQVEEKHEKNVRVEEAALEKVSPNKANTDKKEAATAITVEKAEKIATSETPEVMGKVEDKIQENAPEKVESKALEKLPQIDKKEDVKTPEPQVTSIKEPSVEPTEKKVEPEAKVKATKTDEVKKAEKESEEQPEKEPEKVKEDAPSKATAEKKVMEKKNEKKSNTEPLDKAKTAKPLTNGSSAALSKEVAKAKPAVTSTVKPSTTTKTRLATSGAPPIGAAATKRPTPSSAATDRKPTAKPTSTTTATRPPTTKPPTTATTVPRRPLNTTTRPPTASTAATRDIKTKTGTERRANVPKAASDSTSTDKNGTAAPGRSGTTTRTTTRTTPSTTTTRTTPSTTTTRTTPSTTTARRPLATKTEAKPREEKKATSTLRTSTDSTKPKVSVTRTTTTSSSTSAARTRLTATKPTAHSSSSVGEKKPAAPRTPRPTSSTSQTTTARTTTAPDIRNARSKIGSTDNIKHQPGGGKMSSSTLSRAVPSKDPIQGKLQITNKKVDLSKVTSKCGSKDNIKHKPGGGDLKIESHKVNVKDKVQSKVGSLDNEGHPPGGSCIKTEGDQESDGNVAPLSVPPEPYSEVGAAHLNGIKKEEGTAALDPLIPETN